MTTFRFRRWIRAWGRRQLYSFFSSLGTLWSHRLGTLMTMLVLGIAMVLPLGLYVTVQNLRAMDLQQENWGTITVLLKAEAEAEQALALAQRIGREMNATAESISPEQGMEEFREASGFALAPDLFDENPLPWVLLATPIQAADEDLGSAVAELAGWLEEQDEVDIVQVDYKWMQRLAALLHFGDAVVSVLTVMFALAVVVVIANTIRLDVANRAEEIQILSLVGAGNSFIRQPFLYSGLWYGLLGSVLALLLLKISVLYLGKPLESLMDAYGSSFVVLTLDGGGIVLVLLLGALLGLTGASLSVQRHLRQFREGRRPGR